MFDLFVLAALPLPTIGMPSLLDLAKIFGVPVALYLLARFVTRRDKLRDEVASEEAKTLKTRNESADTERIALRTEVDRNKTEHERFHQMLHEMRGATQLIQNDVQALKMDVARSDMRNEGFKETLGRIDGQLGRLIDNYRTLS